jgi:GNAT superfamily N-acetyltransferase
MKTFKQFITEGDISKNFIAPGIDAFVWEDKGTITISIIKVDKDKQRTGLGTKFMKSVCAYADNTKQRVALSPTIEFGASSLTRLKKFYKSFGFVDNRGRNKDYTTRQSMIRNPD